MYKVRMQLFCDRCGVEDNPCNYCQTKRLAFHSHHAHLGLSVLFCVEGRVTSVFFS